MRNRRNKPPRKQEKRPKEQDRTFRSRLKPKTQNQAELIRTIAENSVTLAMGPAGSGKALSLDSKLFTRTGPIKMGDVKVGDEIADPSGGFSKVTGVYPQGEKEAYRVYFSNGCYVECCEEHLWRVEHKDHQWSRVVDTKYLMSNCRRKDGKRLLSVACSKPVGFDRKDHLIDAYFMGIIISEGGLTNYTLNFGTCEPEILERVECCLKEGCVRKSSTHKDHRVVKSSRSSAKNEYIQELRRLSLWDKYAYEKHIPDIYKYASVDQRIALLQGLMDGDGTVSKTGAASYCTTSKKLIEDFAELIYSLGGTTKIREKKGALKEDGTRHRKSYFCSINLPNEIKMFFLNRKVKRMVSRTKYMPKFYVDRVEKVGVKEMQCISVDNKDSLYLTDNYIPTHNTKVAVAYGIEKLLVGDFKRLVITRPVVEAGERLGYLPGSYAEKIDPYLQPVYYELLQYLSKAQLQEFINNGTSYRGSQEIIIAPLAYMRGMNYHDSYMVLDEAQNCTPEQIKLFITRVGFNSKAVLVGDDKQTDLQAGRSGLAFWYERLQGIQEVGTFRLENIDIVRNPVISRILQKIGE